MMLRFRVHRYPVTVQPGALVLAGIVVLYGLQIGQFTAPAAWIGIGFVSLMVHELGHAVTADRFGLGPVDIRLTQLGGLTRHQRPDRPWKMLLIALAGPGAGLGLAAAAMGAAVVTGEGFVHGIAADIVYINVLWSLFNLLPLFPMDGGMATSAVLQMVTRGLAWPITWGIGLVLSAALAATALAAGELFMAALAALFASQNGRALWTWRKARQHPPRTRELG